MIDRLDAVAIDRPSQQLAVEHRAENRDHARLLVDAPLSEPRQRIRDLGLDLKERRLGQLEEDEAARLLAQHLAHELAADRAPGAGHHHGAPADDAGEQRLVGRHRIAAEQVVDVDRLQIGHGDAAQGDVLHRRHGLDPNRMRRQSADRLATFPALSFRQGKQHLPHLVALDQPRQLVEPIDLEPAHVLSDEPRLIVDEADGAILAPPSQRFEQLDAGRPGAVDDDVSAVLLGRRASRAAKECDGRRLTARPQKHARENRIDHNDAARHDEAGIAGADRHEDHEPPQQNGKRDAAEDAQRTARAEKTRHKLVEPERMKYGDADGGCREEDQPEDFPVRNVRPSPAERESEPHRQRQQDEIVQNEKRALDVPRLIEQPLPRTSAACFEQSETLHPTPRDRLFTQSLAGRPLAPNRHPVPHSRPPVLASGLRLGNSPPCGDRRSCITPPSQSGLRARIAAASVPSSR